MQAAWRGLGDDLVSKSYPKSPVRRMQMDAVLVALLILNKNYATFRKFCRR